MHRNSHTPKDRSAGTAVAAAETDTEAAGNSAEEAADQTPAEAEKYDLGT